MDNYAIADQFSLLSKLMDIHGENSFKSKSYSSAAFTIEKLPQEIAGMPREKIFQVKGIGVWTAHMFLIFSLGRLDVLPVGDLGVRRGIERAYGLSDLPHPAEIERLAEERSWHPYCSVVSWYLWRSLENKSND